MQLAEFNISKTSKVKIDFADDYESTFTMKMLCCSVMRDMSGQVYIKTILSSKLAKHLITTPMSAKILGDVTHPLRNYLCYRQHLLAVGNRGSFNLSILSIEISWFLVHCSLFRTHVALEKLY